MAAGRELLAAMPYNRVAVEWSDRNFDRTYAATWWPSRTPTLILSGGEDRIVDQSLWQDPHYQGTNVEHITVPEAAHFLWIERPSAVRTAFDRLNRRL